MTAVQELNKRLQNLSEDDREAMAAALLEEMDAQAWDQQIAADAEAGKLDKLIEKAKQDHRAGRTTPLPR
jgi:uncharacterized coiled-coil protein SlyX